MDFKILGTGSATPQLDRNASAFVVSIENELILIDCGEGTQYRLLEHKVKTNRIKYILISHLHGDHYFGLIGLLSSMNLGKRTEDLTLIGPQGLDEILSLQFKHSQTFLNFKIDFKSTNPDESIIILETDNFKVTTIPLMHRIPCNGYLITENASKRTIIKEKMPPDLPIPYIKMLKEGKDVYDDFSKTKYLVSDFTEPGNPEKSLAYCSDTAYLESIIPIIQNCDLLYHEATFGNELTDRATVTYHSTAAQAALIAKKSKVKKLVIGHFSSRYKSLELLEEEAKAVFEPTFIAKEGLIFEV